MTILDTVSINCRTLLCFVFIAFFGSMICAYAEVEIGEDEEGVPFEMPSDLLEPTLQARSGLEDRLAHFLSADLRALEARQSEIVEKLEELPQFLLQSVKPVEFGYHANPNRKRPKWIQLDFGQRIEPDAIALVPVTVQFEGRSVLGYGFPKAFRVDISDDENFASYETLVEYSKGDAEVFQQAPFYAELSGGMSGRFVRLTATQLWSPENDPSAELFALGELMVLKGPRNLAIKNRVTSRDSVERGALWRIEP